MRGFFFWPPRKLWIFFSPQEIALCGNLMFLLRVKAEWVAILHVWCFDEIFPPNPGLAAACQHTVAERVVVKDQG